MRLFAIICLIICLPGVAQAERILASAAPPAVDMGYDASTQIEDGTPGVWEPYINTTGSPINYTLGGSPVPTLTTSDPSPYFGINAAYDFSAGSIMDGGDMDAVGVTSSSASFEVWFKPNSFGGGGQVLFEAGGSGDGTSITLEGERLRFLVKNQGNSVVHSVDLLGDLGLDTADFIQAVGVYDRDNPGSTDAARLFVNGAEVLPLGSDATGTAVNDWAGPNATAIGSTSGNSLGGENASPFSPAGFGSFEGQIAIFNFYGRALLGEEVSASFETISFQTPLTPEPASLALFGLSLGGFGLYHFRRRR